MQPVQAWLQQAHFRPLSAGRSQPPDGRLTRSLRGFSMNCFRFAPISLLASLALASLSLACGAAATSTLVSNTTLISCWCLKRLRGCSALNPRRTAFGVSSHLLQGRHGGVAGEGG